MAVVRAKKSATSKAAKLRRSEGPTASKEWGTRWVPTAYDFELFGIISGNFGVLIWW